MNVDNLKYKVIVVADQFATNFAKEMCVWTTGQIGDDNVGVEYRFKSDEEIRTQFADSMERRMCNDERWRPVEECSDDSNSFEMYFKKKPTKEMMEHINACCNAYADDRKKKNPIMARINIKEVKLLVERTLSYIQEINVEDDFKDFNGCKYIETVHPKALAGILSKEIKRYSFGKTTLLEIKEMID